MATLNQKRVFDKITKKVGNGVVEVGPAMRGIYADSVTRNPSKLTRSKGWQELMEMHLPDKELAKKHRAMLNKTEKIVVSDGARDGSHIEDTHEPHADVNRALDMAYKLKGRYVGESEGHKTLILVVSGESAQRYGVNPTSNDEKELQRREV